MGAFWKWFLDFFNPFGGVEDKPDVVSTLT